MAEPRARSVRPKWLDRPIYRPVCGNMTPSELSLVVRRQLRLTPMFRILKEFERRGVDVSSLAALEMFGGDGTLYTVDYATHVRSLEVWEIDPRLAPILRANLPAAAIKTVDTYVELSATTKKYGIVFADPPYEVFAGRCEHFELFPDVFRLLEPSAILVLSNVRLNVVTVERYSKEHLERRRDFYGVEDPTEVSLAQMLKTYADLAAQNGFTIKWSSLVDRIFLYPLQRRSVDRTCFLILGLEKR
jgi:16S rRNA G966 N2-methylase RsmD